MPSTRPFIAFFQRTLLRCLPELGAQGAYNNTGKFMCYDGVIFAVGSREQRAKAIRTLPSDFFRRHDHTP